MPHEWQRSAVLTAVKAMACLGQLNSHESPAIDVARGGGGVCGLRAAAGNRENKNPFKKLPACITHTQRATNQTENGGTTRWKVARGGGQSKFATGRENKKLFRKRVPPFNSLILRSNLKQLVERRENQSPGLGAWGAKWKRKMWPKEIVA